MSSLLINGISFNLNENSQVRQPSSPCVIDGELKVNEEMIEVNEKSCEPNNGDKESGEQPTNMDDPPDHVPFIHKAVEPRETANYDASTTDDKPEPQQEERAEIKGEIEGLPELQSDLPEIREDSFLNTWRS